MDIIDIWGFPKIRGTFLGVPIIRIIVYWGPLILGKLPHLCRALGGRVSLEHARSASNHTLVAAPVHPRGCSEKYTYVEVVQVWQVWGEPRSYVKFIEYRGATCNVKYKLSGKQCVHSWPVHKNLAVHAKN